MGSVLDYFLSVRKGEVVQPSLNARQDQVILRMREVVGWCKHGMMEVEIVSGSKAERRRCTEGLLSFDMMDTLEYYPYEREGLHLPNLRYEKTNPTFLHSISRRLCRKAGRRSDSTFVSSFCLMQSTRVSEIVTSARHYTSLN